MADASAKSSADLVRSPGSWSVIWGLPNLAIIAALFADLHLRTAIWTLALLWMGTACLLNARRCGRTHCRYTGPYYLIMMIPVLVFGSEVISFGSHGWLILAVMIIGGSKLIWWAAERKF